jgi:UDPglucose 6-dehydrogenase
MARIAVVGSGYVGLTTGACLAHLGHEVTCVDVDADKVARLRAGEVPVHEPGLDRVLADARAAGRLGFTDDPVAGVRDAEFVYLCLPTPRRPDGAADLSAVTAAASTIGPELGAGTVVVTKSTVPVGAHEQVAAAIGRGDVAVVANPEFLREGAAIADFLGPDRVVVGAHDRTAAHRVAALHSPPGVPVVVTDPTSAETIKYASNAFLATRLSFCNGVAALCEAVGADVDDVLVGMGHDRRIGHHFLRPGPGWGGSCFPKDTEALLAIAADHGYEFGLLRHAVAENHAQFDRVVDKVVALAGGSVAGVRIAAWGLTFKADTDDLRGSPATEILRRLVDAGARVCAYDPTVRRPPAGLAIDIADDPYTACDGARVLVVLTEWDELRDADLGKVAEVLAARNIVDARNLLDRAEVARLGFTYRGIGRN